MLLSYTELPQNLEQLKIPSPIIS